MSDLTGFPEILGGRVKTLHPSIHGGILARRQDPGHQQELKQHHIKPIDLVVVNLYPFAQTASRAGASQHDIEEMIDVGGPTMVRAAAKNYRDVVVVVDPADYPMVLDELRRGIRIPEETRRRLALKAFEHTAFYDAQIANYLRTQDTTLFPDELTVPLRKVQVLRYGENPHQAAALYVDASTSQLPPGISSGRQIQGKLLSFNNLEDLDAAWAVATDFSAPAVAIVKHGNPAGLACASTPAEAFRRALDTDPKSAFGGAVGVNRVVDEDTAREISQGFFEDLIAPGYTDAALDILKPKRDLRVMAVGEDWQARHQEVRGFSGLDFRRILGGFLVQQRDRSGNGTTSRQVVDQPGADPGGVDGPAVRLERGQARALQRYSAGQEAGAGRGGSRADEPGGQRGASHQEGGDQGKGSVMASDAYFPFPDGIEAAADAGVTAVIQPGGSVRDQRGHQGGQRGPDGDDLHRPPPLQALANTNHEGTKFRVVVGRVFVPRPQVGLDRGREVLVIRGLHETRPTM